MINRSVLAALVGLSSCVHPAPPPPSPGPVKFIVGYPYQVGGEWRYPRNFNSYDVTGLATVYGEDAPYYTGDNETYDASALAAASPVLQLPAIVTVTNLVNGYSTQVRVNDRGPAMPGRVLEVTPRVASLLGFPLEGVVEVEVTLDAAKTAALDGALGAGPKITAAPVAGVTAQPLGPPGGANPAIIQNLTPQAGDNVAAAVPLSGEVTVTPPSPGPLYVQIPGFGREYDAFRMMARLGDLPVRIVPMAGGDRVLYAVEAGPYTSVAAADAALQQVLDLGVSDPEIIVR